jgi:hypothetical protein
MTCGSAALSPGGGSSLWALTRTSSEDAALLLHHDLLDQREIGDPEGTRLPDDDAAIQYARGIIDDLNEDQLPGEPGATIIVKNEAGEVVYRFPSSR